MNSEYVQTAILAFDTYVTVKNAGLLLIIMAPVFAIGMIGMVYWMVRQDCISKYAPTKDERKKGFDYINMRNPRNFKLLNFPQTNREKSDAQKWRTKADFVLGKEVIEQLMIDALRYDFGLNPTDEHS